MTLFGLALGWLLGIGLGSHVALSTPQWLMLAALALAARFLFRHGRSALAFGGLLVLFCGAARFQSNVQVPAPNAVRWLNDSGRSVRLIGMVADYPDVRDAYTGLRLRVQQVEQDGELRAAQGNVLVFADRSGDWAYGDMVEAFGRLETPPEFPDFSYRDYLARQGVHSLMARAGVTRLASGHGNPVLQRLYAYRTRAQAVLRALVPQPEASLLSGILLGIESGIPADLRQAYNATGTAHIIAISGFNVAIIAGLFGRLFTRWLGARRGSLAALLGIAVYTVLVGAGASVVRAALMAGLALVAQRLGRQGDALAGLGAAGIGMTLANPYTVWDVGFQLSFGATLGLVLYAEPLKAALVRTISQWMTAKRAARLAGPVGEYALFTLAAQVTTLPLTAAYFHRLSLVALIANPVVLPAQPAVMILGGLAALAGSIWLPLGRPLAWTAWPFVAFTNRVVEWFASWPSASLPLGDIGPLLVGAYYAALFGLTFGWGQLRARWPQVRLPGLHASAGLSALAIASIFVWRAAYDRPDGLLRVTVLDVGGAGATLIESPTGRSVLVDSGPSPVALAEALGRRLPFHDSEIDVYVMSGSPGETCAGLQDLEGRFPIALALVPTEIAASGCREAEALLASSGTRFARAAAGMAVDLGAGAQLEVLSSSGRGLALGLVHHKARLLLPLGTDPDRIDSLLRSGELMQAQVLVLADGGYAAVNPPELFERVRPWVVVIPVEAGNKRGLPSPEVVAELEGTAVLRTDLHGWIAFQTDGQRLWVEVERPQDPD
jgi:competence protein ComEC